MSIQLLLLSQPITNSYLSYPSSQSVRFMKFLSSDWFSFLIYLCNFSFKGKVDADLWASLSAGWDQSKCCFSYWCDMSAAGGQSETGSLPSELTTVKGVTHIALMRSPALVHFVLQAREYERVKIRKQETRRNWIVSLHNAGCWIANCFWSFKQNVQREWTAFKPTVIYGSCGLQWIIGKKWIEREREACWWWSADRNISPS